MALLVDQLASWLQTQGEGTVGTNLFKLFRPNTPIDCTTLYMTGGYPPPDYTGREKPTIQVVARAASPGDAASKAYEIFSLIRGRQCLDLGRGIYVNYVREINPPASIGEEIQDGKPAYLCAFNLLFDLKRPSN